MLPLPGVPAYRLPPAVRARGSQEEEGTAPRQGERGQASCAVFLGLIMCRKPMAIEVLLVITWHMGR